MAIIVVVMDVNDKIRENRGIVLSVEAGNENKIEFS